MAQLDTDFAPTDHTLLEIGGVQGKMYGIDYNDWINATVTADADGTVTGVVLPTGKKAVEYDLPQGAITPTTPLTRNEGGKSGFTHTFQAFVPTKSQAIKKELLNYVNYRRLVWIILVDSSIVAQVFGSDVGTMLTAYEEAATDPAKGGGLDLTFSTPTNVTLENMPPVTFKDTDRATTEAALVALKTPAP